MCHPRFEVIPCRLHAGEWRVEGCNPAGDGECLVAIFTGPGAEARARRYLSIVASC